MSQVIFKYEMPAEDNFVIYMPQHAQVLCAQVQNANPQLWALVDPNKPLTGKHFILRATGVPVDAPDAKYVSTFQLGDFVFHLFEDI